MMSTLYTIASFVVAIGLLIAVHEFGHFWVARRLGVKVLRFSIGFGKPIWRRLGRDGTEYVVAALPLGGYVRMLDEREGDVPEALLSQAFNRQSVARRAAIVAAGPAFNLVFAVLAYWLVLIMGVPGLKPLIGHVQADSPAARAGLLAGDEMVAVNGRAIQTWESASLAMIGQSLDQNVLTLDIRRGGVLQRGVQLQVDGLLGKLGKQDPMRALGLRPPLPPVAPVLGELLPEGAAALAGLKSGDRLVSVDGVVLQDWFQWVDYVRERAGASLAVTLQRGTEQMTVTVTPAVVEQEGERIGRIGAAPASLPNIDPKLLTTQQYGVVEALLEGAVKTWDMSVMTLRILSRMLSGQVSLDNISGPITIADYAGKSADSGLIAFVSFLAIISISLGILNLLPVPVLDGGHLLYFAIEAIKGSPLSDAAQLMGQKVGMILMAMLMVLAVYNDLARLFG